LEWSRLFVLSGYSLNPTGLAATGSLYVMQTASLWGVLGLTFWVMFVNLLALKNWLSSPKKTLTMGVWLLVLAFPFLYGAEHIAYHSPRMENTPTFFNAALVQTAFPAEEAFEFKDSKSFIAYVFEEWRKILQLVKKHHGQELDLVALPEFVVPLGTYSFVYPYEAVKNAIVEILGPDSEHEFPELQEPLARKLDTVNGPLWVVNNAFWAQTVANYFNAPLIVGMEDAEDNAAGEREHYSAALLFTPKKPNEPFDALRYSKRVLVPMAEYIPFSFCRTLAAQYGITGSFTCGKEAVAWDCKGVPLGVSICYEETFGSIMRESTQKGAKAHVNLTSDVWFPDSKLAQQHFDHSRLRTVENGIPLLRSCNTGITCALDSLGRPIAALNETHEDGKWLADSLEVHVPLYTYSTLYSRYGDAPVLMLCGVCIAFFLFTYRRKD
jgi:apolipoprotein N-acyltransferase